MIAILLSDKESAKIERLESSSHDSHASSSGFVEQGTRGCYDCGSAWRRNLNNLWIGRGDPLSIGPASTELTIEGIAVGKIGLYAQRLHDAGSRCAAHMGPVRQSDRKHRVVVREGIRRRASAYRIQPSRTACSRQTGSGRSAGTADAGPPTATHPGIVRSEP